MVNIKNSGQSGITKKMLHAPSLKLFIAKEIPIASKEAKISVRNYLDDWVRHTNAVPLLLGVTDILWHTPEGYVTILTENCPQGSLKDLLGRVESLTEAAIIPIAREVLHALYLFHNKFHAPFRSLSLRQILFSGISQIKIAFGFSRRLNYLSIKAKNNKEKDFLNVDCFEVGLILLKCAVGDLLDEFLHVMSGCFNKELFLSARDCTNTSEKNKIDVFRILDNYPIKDLNLIITDKLCEHYSSFYKFLLGELRDHVRHNYFDTMLAKDKTANLKIKVLRKMMKSKLTSSFSNGFGTTLKWLTKFDSEDRCLPQDALGLDYFKLFKPRPSTLGLDSMQLVSLDSVEKDQQEIGLGDSNVYLEKLANSLAMMYETGERWYELEGGSQASQEFSLPFSTSRRGRFLRYTPDSEQIVELSAELGCPKQTLWNGLKKLVSTT